MRRRIAQLTARFTIPSPTIEAEATIRGSRRGTLPRAALASSLLSLVGMAQAQVQHYADYPQTRGKTQQIKSNYMPSWLIFDGELRGRIEGESSYNGLAGSGQAYGLTRVRAGLHLRPTSFLTMRLQFQDTHAPGLSPSLVNLNMHDTFDLREGYLLLQHRQVKAFIGRQELKFGSERLIGVSDFTNTSRTFDGFDLQVGDKNRVDLFSSSVVTTHPTSLDKHGAGLTFHGVYGQISTWIPDTDLQPFIMIKALPSVRGSHNAFGPELETTVGAEVEGTLPVGFDYDVLGALQRGSRANNSIQASAGFMKFAYFVARVPWTPRLGGEYDYASGDSQQANVAGTFDQQYPSNHNAFGLSDLLGFQNIRQTRVNLDLAPSKNLSLLIQGGVLNLASRHDSLYGSGSTALAPVPAAGFTSSAIGEEIDASGKYVYHNVVVFNAGIGRLLSGPVMRSSGLADKGTSGYFSVTYRFKIGE